MARSDPKWFDAALERITQTNASIAVLGCGYVGLTLALELAGAGFTVVGIETDDRRAKDLRAGANPVPDVLVGDGELARLRDEGRLTFQTSLDRAADVYVLCVNTPLRDGSPDLRYIESAGESVSKVLAEGALVVLESTTYPGTTEELLGPLLQEATSLEPGRDFALAHSPERIDPGNRSWTMQNTPKVVGGLTVSSTELAAALYARICDDVVPTSSPRAAEITKLFENTYREVNIALANEMAIVCHDFDIDPWEVLRAASTKPFGFTPFRPGPGVGGHCLLPTEQVYVRNGDGVRVLSVRDLWDEAVATNTPTTVGGVDTIKQDGLQVAALSDDVGDWNDVALLGRRGFSGETVAISTREGRRLEVTADHPMLTWHDGRLEARPARELREGDFVPVWRGDEIWDALVNPRVDLLRDTEWPAGSNVGVRLTNGDWKPWKDLIRRSLGAAAADEVIRRGRLPLHTFRELERRGLMHVSHDDLVLWTGRGPSARSMPAVVELTPDIARLVGYYLSEGCVTGTAPRIVLAFHRDETDAKQDVLKLLGSLGIEGKTYEDPNFLTTQIRVGHHLFAVLLRDVLGCGANSYDAKVPSQLMGASAVHRRELLAGLLRGDGSVWTENKRRTYRKGTQEYTHDFRSAEVGYWSVSLRLAADVEYLLLSLGYVPELKSRPTQPGLLLRIHGSQDLAWLADVFCDRKRERLASHMSDLKTPRRRSRSYRREGELHLAQIKTLEWGTHHGFVYSLETEPSHTFAATHGIVVHNCIPVDPQYLAWRVRGKVGRQFRLLETASDINQRMPSYVVQRAAEILNGEGKALRGARVLLLGVSYKGGSGDVRESPSLRVADRLVASGADVSYHDPYVPNVAIGGVVYDSQPLDDAILQTSDLVIVLTDHPDVDYERVIAGAGCVYDTRGVTAALVPPSGHSLHRI